MEPSDSIRLDLEAYTVGWVCVNDSELTAARFLLDESHDHPHTPNDNYTYFAGRMGRHNVVIAKSNNTGTSAAATAATNMVRTFRMIRFVLMVGIAGGATSSPSLPGSIERTTPIFLGDVVVSAPHGGHGGILQYDNGKQIAGGHQIRSHLNKPGGLLMQATSTLRQNHGSKHGNMHVYLQQAREKLRQTGRLEFESPGQDYDNLFTSEYCHLETEEEEERCGRCDRARLVNRTPRNTPHVHYGLIGTAESLMQDAKRRDALRRSEKILCFEMETAGLMDSFPCLAIRGISDYADSHKDDLWQPCAALNAAAYAKDLLSVVQPEKIAEAEAAVKWEESVRKVKERVDEIYTRLEDNHRNEIINSLTSLDFLADQRRLLENRAPTGDWLIESEAFRRWADGTDWQLRCYGEVGLGKTYLCALVVKYLQETYPSRPVIYLYLSDEADRRDEQTKDHIIGSLVKQLLEFNPTLGVPPRLRNAAMSQRPSQYTMRTAFEELLQAYERTYLIVDGVHLCSADVQELVKDYPLQLTRQGSKLSLLTTTHGYRQVAKVIHCNRCRKKNLNMFFYCVCDAEDYDLCFECKHNGASCPKDHAGQETYDTVRIEVRPREGEIAKFCYHALSKASIAASRQWDKRVYPVPPFKIPGVARYLSRNPDLIDQVAEVIAMKAQGNFLIAQGWIENILSIREEPRDSDELLADLDRMPFDVLNNYFNQRKQNMEHYKSRQDVSLADNTIALVRTVCRPINMLTLRHGLALMSGARSIDSRYLQDQVTILKATNGLITVDRADEASSFVRFFHGAIRIVLADSDPQSAHSKTAFLCMDYLAHEDYAEHSANLAAYPFLSYVLEHWGDHVHQACSANDYLVPDKAYGLLKNSDKVKAIAHAAGDLSPRTPALWIHIGIDALHLCAWYGLSTLIRRLIRDGGHDINVIDHRLKRSPLRYACVRGHDDTVEELLRLGASPSTAAITDAIHGIPETERPHEEEMRRVKIAAMCLLKRGLTIDSGIYGQNTTILIHAVKNGYFNFVQTLLETLSVDINVPDKDGRTALWYAVSAPPAPLVPCSPVIYDDVVKLLLKRNSNPNVKCEYTGKTVLARAIAKGNPTSVQAVLQCGSLEISDSKELIDLANARGNTEIIEMTHSAILRKGITKNPADAQGESASSSPLNEMPVERKLAAGADIRISGDNLPDLEIRTMKSGVNLVGIWSLPYLGLGLARSLYNASHAIIQKAIG
ncbi:hypothetical protein BJX99DRAFT_258332 [Aspergillus californicus]